MVEIDENETILLVVRRHWIVLLMNGIVLLGTYLIPVVALSLFHFVPIEELITFDGNVFYIGLFFFFAWTLIMWMVAWNMWTNYYLDTIIITNKRLFNIEQYGLFRRESNSFRADRIQNVSVRVNGIIQTLLDYGTIRIETAGEKEDFVAPHIPHPYEIKRLVGEQQDRAMDQPQHGHNRTTIHHDDSGIERPTRRDGEGL